MATQVSYNGINLGLVRTVKVEQKGKYEPHNVDMLFVANRFSVRSVISQLGLAIGKLDPSDAGENPAETMARIRHMLLVPRRAFSYHSSDAAGAYVLLSADADTDSDNGPKPISCDIIQVSEKTWIIDYVIDVAVQDCNASQQFASNRFETTHDIDHKGYSVITTLGRVIVRSDMKVSPDALRPVVTPPLPAGFRRKSSYQLSHDGLAMDYKITDTEFYLSPPSTAVEAHGRFSITAVPPGALMWAQVDLRLEGKKDQNKRQLMETAVLMALRRLEDGGVTRDPIHNRPLVLGGAMSEELFENVVEVQLRGQVLMGNRLTGPNDQKDFFKKVWRGVFGGMIGLALPPAPLAVANANNALITAVKNPPAVMGGLLGVIAAAASQTTQQAKANAATVKDDPHKPPRTPRATLEGGLLDRFGAKLEGTSQRGSVDPGLRGNVGFLGFVAAAFRDPCVAEEVNNTLSTNPNLNWSQEAHLHGGRPAQLGERAGRTFEFETGNRADENRGYEDAVSDYKVSEAQELAQRLLDTLDPSYDWLAGRLTHLAAANGVLADDAGLFANAAGLLIVEVEVLPEDDKPIQAGDPYPGWYDNWFAEITHDINNNRDVLPATVTGYDAVQVQWANPLRTIKIRWACTKSDFPPEIPMIVGDANTVILRHHMELPTVELAADGQTMMFTISGETTYKTLSDAYGEVRWPVPPWLEFPMRLMPGPIVDPNVVVTGGQAGADQDAVIAQLAQIAGKNQQNNAIPPVNA